MPPPPGCDVNSGVWGYPRKRETISRAQARGLGVGEESLLESQLWPLSSLPRDMGTRARVAQ